MNNPDLQLVSCDYFDAIFTPGDSDTIRTNVSSHRKMMN